MREVFICNLAGIIKNMKWSSIMQQSIPGTKMPQSITGYSQKQYKEPFCPFSILPFISSFKISFLRIRNWNLGVERFGFDSSKMKKLATHSGLLKLPESRL